MSRFTVERIEYPSEAQIDASVALFVLCMKDDLAAISLCGGDISLLGLQARAILQAGIFAGEYYAATDENGNILAFTMWMPPGQEMLSTPEQRALGFEEFIARLPQAGKEYFKNVYLAEFPGFVASCLGTTGKLDSWWLHMAMVVPEWRRQGIAKALIGFVRAKAAQKGETLALSTTASKNVPIYRALGFELKGERVMPSPWGDWPFSTNGSAESFHVMKYR
ncbi:hypothetical protein A0H81_04828 [Grifola frondosa]|uniref:N-acetyltransferase domain-containing protein n=1 Tax=Grifola frondosa TaxID=5627 RepID=A0A1C7MFM4_GRIFR|nr:hypothetical protein A0H81_04828 [Grifola frondosa]